MIMITLLLMLLLIKIIIIIITIIILTIISRAGLRVPLGLRHFSNCGPLFPKK